MNKAEELEFQKDLELDLGNLEVDAGMQGELFYKWASKCIDAKERVDNAKLAADTIEASLDGAARADPQSFGILKATEGAIAKAIVLRPEYREAQEALIEAKAEYMRYDMARQAFDQRKSMIEKLVALHGQMYFAGPSVPHDMADASKMMRAQRGAAVSAEQKKQVRQRKSK